MDARQHLFYATGILAYGIAKADGKVQLAEREKLHQIVNESIGVELDAHYTEIIFDLLDHDKMGLQGVYQWAMESFETGKHHLTEALRKSIVSTVQKVAEAFGNVTAEEKNIIAKFESDLDKIRVNNVI